MERLLNAIKLSIKKNPWYTLSYFILLGAVGFSGFLEYHRQVNHLLNLIQDQAATTAAVIAQSGSSQATLHQELEQSYLEHGYDLLALLQQAERERDLDVDQLYALFPENSILELTIFDKEGNMVPSGPRAAARRSPEVLQKTDWIAERIAPLLNQEADYVIQDFRLYDSLENKNAGRYMVALARPNGGALAVALDAMDEENLSYLTTMQTALGDLIQVKGMRYVQLSLDDQDTYSIFREGVQVDSTWQREALDDIIFRVWKDDTQLVEVIRPVFFESGIGEVRIGFDGESLFDLRRQMIYEVSLRSVLLTLLALVSIFFLITRQNTRFLEEEKQRIEKEVYRLEGLNRQREKQAAMGELAAGVAHEIRNPLNAIGIIAQRLTREFSPDKDAEEFRELTGSMSSEIQRINKTLQEFLAYTKPTPLDLAPLDGPEIMDELNRLYQSQAQELGVHFKVESEVVTFQADRQYLKQAVSNLIKNALEASQTEGTVTVGLARDASDVVIEVSDRGSGMEPEEITRIFDLYYSSKDMGTGVGLALTHKIIADHHGSIEVESTPGKGSCFKMRIPVKP